MLLDAWSEYEHIFLKKSNTAAATKMRIAASVNVCFIAVVY